MVQSTLVSPYSFVGIKGHLQVPNSVMKREDKLRKAKNIINACIIFYGVGTLDNFLKPNRTSDVVKARHIAAYLIKMHTGMTDVDMCKLFNRDRTTCIHSVQVITGYLKVGDPPEIKDELRQILDML